MDIKRKRVESAVVQDVARNKLFRRLKGKIVATRSPIVLGIGSIALLDARPTQSGSQSTRLEAFDSLHSQLFPTFLLDNDSSLAQAKKKRQYKYLFSINADKCTPAVSSKTFVLVGHFKKYKFRYMYIMRC